MSRVRAILREPVAHFLIIGAALFLYYELTNESLDASSNRIVVEVGQVAQIAAQFSRTWLRPPTEEELDGLIDAYIREEVFYREALAMGLDQDDPVVRQRLRLKLEFLLEDLTQTASPDDAVLQEFLEKNADRFRREPEIAFRQVYLNPERHADFDAVVQETLERLEAGAEPETLSDSSMLPSAFEAATPTRIARSFGKEFARQLSDLGVGHWRGPVISGLGAHVVEISEKTEGRLPTLAEIRPLVERDDIVVEPFDPTLVIDGSRAGQ
jgi:hypothetical protein